MLAASMGHTSTMLPLILAGAHVNVATDGVGSDEQGNSPLTMATSYGHRDAVALLLEHRAHVGYMRADGKSALHRAARYGYDSVLSLLMKANADVNVTAATASASFEAKKREQARRDAGVEEGFCPLHEASFRGHVIGAQVAHSRCYHRRPEQ